MAKIPTYFNYPEKVFRRSSHRCQIGAAILYKGKPISTGYNKKQKTHTITRKYNKHQTIHAEVAALLKIRHKHKDILPKCKMVVYRETRNGCLGMCRPCKTCVSLIKSFGIKKNCIHHKRRICNGDFDFMNIVCVVPFRFFHIGKIYPAIYRGAVGSTNITRPWAFVINSTKDTFGYKYELK